MTEYVADLVSRGQIVLGDEGINVAAKTRVEHLNVLATDQCNARAEQGWKLVAATDSGGRIMLFFERRAGGVSG